MINHTTQAERSFYEAILLNESLGFDREDAIRRVGLANQTNISPTDVDIKYQAIENASLKIKNGLDGVFGTDVFNLSAMRIKAEKYTKFLLRFGTNKDIAIKTAVEDLKNSHVLINNHLITKFANLPSNFEEKTNILAEKLKEENPQLRDAEGIAFIPMDGRVDKFHVYVDGEPQFGSGYIISKEDFDKAIEFKREKIKKEASKVIKLEQNQIDKQETTEKFEKEEPVPSDTRINKVIAELKRRGLTPKQIIDSALEEEGVKSKEEWKREKLEEAGVEFTNYDEGIAAGETMGSLPGWMKSLCLLYTSPSPRDATLSRMPSSA